MGNTRHKALCCLRLLRPEQYYKNLILFIAIFFSGNLFVWVSYPPLFLGLAALCLLSSVNYLINDILDAKADRRNPEKAGRPIACGDISQRQALAFAGVLLFLAFLIALPLGFTYLLLLAVFFLLTVSYSLWLKHEPYLDIIIISINFVLRAVAGAIIIRVWISPWLVLGMFFLALFMSAGKREAELLYLGKKAASHRIAFQGYSRSMLSSLTDIFAAILILTYSLYCVLSGNEELLLTLPILIFILLRYLLFSHGGSDKARIPNRLFLDARIGAALVFYVLLAAFLLYW